MDEICCDWLVVIGLKYVDFFCVVGSVFDLGGVEIFVFFVIC